MAERVIVHRGHKFLADSRTIKRAHSFERVYQEILEPKNSADTRVADDLLRSAQENGTATPTLTSGPEKGVGQFGKTIMIPDP